MKRNHLLLIVAAWATSLVGAYLIGRQPTRDSATPDASSVERNSPSRQGDALSSLGGGRDSGSAERSAFGAKPSPSASDPTNRRVLALQAALDNENPVERMRLFTEALSKLGPGDFEDAMKLLRESPDRQREISLLVYEWASKDGAAAIAHIAGMENGRSRYWHASTALGAWTRQDPAAAEAWARENHKGEANENYYLVGVINGLAPTDIQAAGRLAQGLGYGRARGQALETVVNQLFKNGPDAAREWAANLSDDDPRFKEGAIGRVAGELAQSDPAAAAAWLNEIGNDSQLRRAAPAIADEWSERNPSEAAQWASQLGDSEARSRSIAEVIENWAQKDAVAAGDYLNTLPESTERDRPVRSYAWSIYRDDPQAALTWAATISNQELRNDTLTEIGQRWMRSDTENARAFIEATPWPAEVRTRLLRPSSGTSGRRSS